MMSVVDNSPNKHHTVTAGYIRRFTHAGQVLRHVDGRKPKPIGPRGVGYQRNFWGSPALAQEMEDAFSKCEDPAIELLREIDEDPNVAGLGAEERGLLAEFMAIHVVRLPAFGRFARSLAPQAARQTLLEHGVLSETNLERAVEALRDPRQHNESLIGRIAGITGVLASMHWSILTFDQDLLITGDTPVVLLPPQAVPITSGSAIPPGGMINTFEGRFTLDPRKVLVMAWRDGPESPTPTDGTFAQACSVNLGVRSLAEREWLSRPGGPVPFVVPPWRDPVLYAISTDMLPGYTVAAAAASTRRSRTGRLMLKRAHSAAPPDRVRFVTPSGATAEV